MARSGEVYDFKAFGREIKKARERSQWTREQVAGILNLAPRYLLSIENNGQHPSLQVFYELVTLFDISVDQFFFPNKTVEKTTQRRQIEKLLDEVDEADLIIIHDTIKGIHKARAAKDEYALV